VEKIIRRFRFVRGCTLSFKKPGPRQTLIYDRSGSDLLLNILDPSRTGVLDIRGESLNVHALIRMVRRRKISLFHYTTAYISFVKPRIIVTTTDTDINFYRLKSTFPEILTVAIQNGIRSDLGPQCDSGFFISLKKLSESTHLSADFICTLGGAIATNYRACVDAKFLTTGALKNNSLEMKDGHSENELLFVSQYPPKWPDNSATCLYYKSYPLSYSLVYSAELLVIQFLATYCRQNQIQLTICGKRNSDSVNERNFYSNALGDMPFEFIPSNTPSDSYKQIARSKIVVTIDSTLGYESLARAKRTAMFSIRGKLTSESIGVPLDDLNFGWPLELPDTGPFWTNTASEAEFSRILNYLMTVSDADWSNEIGKYTEDLMVFDPGNTVLRDLLQRLGADLTN